MILILLVFMCKHVLGVLIEVPVILVVGEDAL